MKALEALWELDPRPSLNIHHVEIFSVGVTLIVYACMLAIAHGVIQRKTAAGVPLKNFLSGLILSALAITFTDSANAHGPAFIQNAFGVFAQLIVCLTLLAYSPDFNKDARLVAAAAVLFSVLANMKSHALNVLTLWSSVHLAVIPTLDYLRTLRSGIAQPSPDFLTLILMTSGILSLFGWGTFILMSGLPLLASTNFLGAIVALASLRNMLTAKEKKA